MSFANRSQQCDRSGRFPPLVRVAFLRWTRFSASTSAHGGGNGACSAITKRKTILLMPSQGKTGQDAFEHICRKRRTGVKQLSGRQRASIHNNTQQRECHTRTRCATTVVKQLSDRWPTDAQRMQGNTPDDLHTIPLRMLCSAQLCMFHEHNLKHN